MKSSRIHLLPTNLRQIMLIFLGRTTQNYSKKIVIAFKPSAALELLSALGGIGRRLESCRPEQLKN